MCDIKFTARTESTASNCGCLVENGCTFENSQGLCRNRDGKGSRLDVVPEDYTIVDLETTGFSPSYDEIIEIAAIKVRGGNIVDRFSVLVRPNNPITPIITSITGISNEMVNDADEIELVLPRFMEFVGGDTIVGHNVNFDINFIYDNFERSCQSIFSNDYVDTMRLAKYLVALQHYRLGDLCEYFGIDTKGAHRALNDCEMTYKVLNALMELERKIVEGKCQPPRFTEKPKRKHCPTKFPNHKDIVPQIPAGQINHDNPLYGKSIVITGELPMPRLEAWQSIVNRGGILKGSVSKKTDILIVGGDLDAENKSSKHEKALKLQAEGCPIKIVDTDVFMEMIAVCNGEIKVS